jgi:hypothetical protein
MDSSSAFELAGTDAIGQAALAASGEISAVELLEAAIARIEATRSLNAVITDLFDRGRAQAAALDESGVLRNEKAGPLAGVPFLLKDLGAALAGAREAMGSRALRDHVATETAWTVQRYLDAGLVVLGKTNTPEWGNHCTTEPLHFRPDGESMVSGCDPRRIQRRFCRGSGRRSGSRRLRWGRNRFHPRAGVMLRRRRPQTAAWTCLLRSRRRPRSRGAGEQPRADPYGARLRGHARRHRRHCTW